MTQKRSYKQYPKAAEALGAAANILYRWKDNAEKQKAGITLSKDERTELKSLRQEARGLQGDNEAKIFR
ncbi:MAG: transposase [Halioglobus sp.]|jgi:transposase